MSNRKVSDRHKANASLQSALLVGHWLPPLRGSLLLSFRLCSTICLVLIEVKLDWPWIRMNTGLCFRSGPAASPFLWLLKGLFYFGCVVL
ncbi:hypothetical protein AB4Z50_27035 [Paenibacillus sp. 2TAB26]|uniref:hypothetical protein n=1 Tax=Paenibacillus sp. 2TAB26 TaxID=3233005 RepID=UPI003F9C0249